MSESKTTSLAEIKAGTGLKAPEAVPSFFSAQGMQLLEKAAVMLTNSDIVPAQYRQVDSKGNQNPSGYSNCIVAVNMAQMIGLDPLTVMQNLHIIEGRPSWSAQFIIARINSSKLFSRLSFDLSDKGEKVEVSYTATKWVNRERQYENKKATMHHQQCRAVATLLETGQHLIGPTVSVEMAIAEGWATKNGSKWHTMQEVMLQYRAAAMWCRIHAPELLSGLPTEDELHDTLEAEIKDGVAKVKPVASSDLKSDKKEVAEDIKVVEKAPEAPSQPDLSEQVEPEVLEPEPEKPVRRGRGQQVFSAE